jgi:putative membrane protein
MRWILAFHIIFVICWFAGLFYLPRLFVYHAMTEDVISLQRFKIMERKLYFGIMLPSALLTILFGGWLIVAYPSYYLHSLWMHVKLTLVFLLIVYQLYCGKLLFDFKQDQNKHSHVFYRVLNEIPVVFLAIIVILAVVKPF